MGLSDTKIVPVHEYFALDIPRCSGLDIRVNGGVLLDGNGYKTITNKDLTLTASATNYVEVSDLGVISSNTTAFTTGATWLYVITTGTAVVTGIADWRYQPAVEQSFPTWNTIRAYLADGMLTIATLAPSAGDATKFKTTTTCSFRVAGVHYNKTATDNLTFTDADTINLAGAATTAHWGAWLVEIGVDGNVHTRHATYTSGTDMDYATEALAVAALPAVTASHVRIGYITVQGLASTAWTANTSNFTVGGGAGNCTARTFSDTPAPATLPAAI